MAGVLLALLVVVMVLLLITASSESGASARREADDGSVACFALGLLLFLALAAALAFPKIWNPLSSTLARDPARLREARLYKAWASRRCVCGYDLRATPNRCPECGLDYTSEIVRSATVHRIPPRPVLPPRQQRKARDQQSQ